MHINAQLFFKAWVEAAHEMRPALLENWGNAGEFTKLVKSSNDCVIRRVAGKVGLECYPHDYYSIDAVLYEKDDLVPDIPEMSTWLTDLSVAFEHENSIQQNIYEEISHLLITNADLRVLVTYPRLDGIEDHECQRAHLIIRGSRYQQQISDKENFLLILGWRTFEWEGFVYKQENWKRI